MTVRFEESYELRRRLGSGRGTDTFEARHRLTGDRVVVKFLLEPLAEHSTDTINNFVRELRVAGAVRHACLSRIMDAGVFEGHVFIVMEYVEGETLGAWLRREGRLEQGEARRVVGMVADALAQIHAADLFHGNLTPENVMIRKTDGGVALTDYALDAAAIRAGAKLDVFREKGSPAADARDDLFALGALLFHCLTGESALKRRNTERLGEQERGAREGGGTDSMPAELESAAVFLMSHPRGDPRDIFEQTADFLLHGRNLPGRANDEKKAQRRSIAPILVSLFACILILLAAAAMLLPRLIGNKRQEPPQPRKTKSIKTVAVPSAAVSNDNARASRIRRANWLYEQAGGARATEDKSAARAPGRMPAIIGLPRAAAVSRLEEAGLRISLEWSSAPGCAPGTVSAQRPAPGHAVSIGASATIVLCSETPRIRTPDMMAMPMEDARIIAAQHQFKIEITERPSPPDQYGRVLAQTPAPGVAAPPGGTVMLTVGAPPPGGSKNIDHEQ